MRAAPDLLLPPAVRLGYRERKAELLARMQSAGAGTRGLRGMLSRLANLADDELIHLWRQARFGPEFALAAVGGFGRGELFPHSDVDVLLLMPAGSSPAGDDVLRERIERFISACWDAGLEVGSSVRTVDECLSIADNDITVQTALLEARLVIGSRKLFQDFHRRFMAQLDALEFFTAKRLEMRQRHTKYEDTPYALEPNCKESPGGLRDLQVILWVARAAGLGSRWDELERAGVATRHELRQLKTNEAVLSLIRARLHLIARRREDRLVFDLQTAVAESFGYANRFTPEGRLTVRASEQLMRRYYWAAKAVTQLNQILMQGIEQYVRTARGERMPRLRRINDRFYDRSGMLEVASDDLYQREPHAILETFLVYAQAPGVKSLSARTLRALYNARPLMTQAFRADPVNRATFMEILRQPQGITHAFRLMNQTSVLGRYLWAFRRIVGQMQHDLFHVYTVDQHILMVLRNMRRFFIPEHAHEYPFCSQLAAGWDKPWVLYVAALFHDIAKGRGGDHSELGAMEVRRFCADHGIGRHDTALIEFLVREHLIMSRVAQKEDLHDPQVIGEFAKRVGDERRLTALYLLTVADVRGTSPKVWNAWKGKLLEDLYRFTLSSLGGREPDANAHIEARKRKALQHLALHALPHDAHRKLWATLDMGYFMRHDPEDIAWHTRLLSRHAHDSQRAGRVAPPTLVRARRSPVGEGLQVLVYTRDKSDLFARICGYFDRAGFSILDARIHTTRDGFALDTFQVITESIPEHYRELISQVEAGMPLALDSDAPLAPPRLGRVSRRVKSFPITPRVDLRPDDKAQRWLLSVSASDRVGLLYGILRVLAAHQIDVELAKISTLGERVEDSFLLRGAQLQHNRTQLTIERELLDVLEAN